MRLRKVDHVEHQGRITTKDIRGEPVTKYTCPCCGYKTLDEEHEYDICPICFWEDDWFQYQNPDSIGANKISLREAQLNYSKFGACERSCMDSVRQPTAHDERDPDWYLLD